MNNVQPIFLSCVEQWCLPVNILIIQIESRLKEQIQAFLFALSANVEKDSLLIIIFEVSVGPVIHKELHKLIGLFVVYQNGREI